MQVHKVKANSYQPQAQDNCRTFSILQSYMYLK